MPERSASRTWLRERVRNARDADPYGVQLNGFEQFLRCVFNGSSDRITMLDVEDLILEANDTVHRWDCP